MIHGVPARVWAFDLEWVPDVRAGRLLLELPDSPTELEVMEEMWRRGGATDDDPTPFLKMSICRIVSVAVIERRVRPDGSSSIALTSLPHDPQDPAQVREASVIGTFLDALGAHRPQLVGFNSRSSDLKILLQRALILGLSAPGFCSRPEKPWEGIDYFSNASEAHVDLKECIGGWGKAAPSLHELAVQSGIPGKLDVDGQGVAELWLRGELDRIVAYNECDAVTTYLVWLRLAHLAGHLSDDGYVEAQRQAWSLLAELADRPHLVRYLQEWARLRSATGQPPLSTDGSSPTPTTTSEPASPEEPAGPSSSSVALKNEPE